VSLRTLADEAPAMRSRGFDATPVAAEIEGLAMDDWRAATRAGGLKWAIGTLCARANYDAGDLTGAIADTQPDAVIVDLLAWGALSAAEAWGGPWACYSPFPLPLPSRAGPPVGPGLRPAHGPLGHLRDRLVQSVSRVGFEHLAGRKMATVRAELGLRPLADATKVFATAPLHIYMSAEPFEYPRPDWPESVVMVGPCAWEPPGDLPAELSEIAEPLVLVTTSTDFQDDGRLVRAALEALAGEPLHVVVTMPSASARVVRLPPNATIFRFAPHSPILQRSVCAITHGGMGATQKALALGVPVCAVPFGRDQPEVARRVQVAAAGSRLPAWRLNPRRLRAKVEEAISCRPGAEEIARAFGNKRGAAEAADAIEQRLLELG
jgi:MGT family glycosyltransferase